MRELIKDNNFSEPKPSGSEQALIEYTEDMLADVRAEIEAKETISMPIAELAILGGGVASIIPSVETITQNTTVAADGLYKLANAAVGDTLKRAKNGNFWGAFKTAEGTSKFAQFQAVGPLPARTTTRVASAINPATMMMAVALFSIEKELANIANTNKQIILFLRIEKEAKIEGDVETLMDVVKKYKDNWNKEQFVNNNHKLMLDIQRSARANIIECRKQVEETIKEKKSLVTQNKVNSTADDLEKKFKYYRLSLYNYSLASMLEVMLSGDFSNGHIDVIRKDLEERSESYQVLFTKVSSWLEKMGKAALEANTVRRIGIVGEVAGKAIGTIPLLKKGTVDEFLQHRGDKLKSSADKMEKKAVKKFEEMSNPGIDIFVNELENMTKIYNNTSEIYFDKDNIYLVVN